jgi:UDP-galactopyranose mutase
MEAIETAFGDGAGRQWTAYVDAFVDDWEALRLDYLERPFSAEHASRHAKALLSTRLTMHKVITKAFKDERLRDVASFAVALEGHDLRNVPAWMGMWSYVEQNFGAWTVSGGMGALADALTSRLQTRGVTVLLSTAALDLELAGGRVAGVRTEQGVIDTDLVVCAVDPRRLPALASYVDRTMPAIPPVICHVGIVGPVPDLPSEVVIHGDPMLVVRTGGQAPRARTHGRSSVAGGWRRM